MTIEFFEINTTNADDAFDWFFDSATMNRIREGERLLSRLSQRREDWEKCQLVADYISQHYKVSLLGPDGCATVDLDAIQMALDYEEWVALLYGQSVPLETGHTLTAEEITDE